MRMRERGELATLLELRLVWDELRLSVEPHHRLSPETLTAFRDLVGRAQVLIGQTSHLSRLPGWELLDPSGRSFQGILATHDLRAARIDETWGFHWARCNSAIVQAIGRQEERIAHREPQDLSPETVLRWRPVIVFLERLRVTANWPFSRIRFLTPFVARVEKWPGYRLISILSDFGSVIALGAFVLAALVFLVRCTQ